MTEISTLDAGLDAWLAARLGVGGGGPVTRAALDHWQDQALRQTLDHVRRHSPFYRRHFAAALPSLPADSTGRADLERLPFTTAADLRADPLQFLCVSQSEISRVVTLDSSGTTGQPKRLFFTAEDQEASVAFFQAGLSGMARPGDTVLILLAGERLGSAGDLIATAATRLGARPIVGGFVRDVAATLGLIVRERPAVIIGQPVPLLAVARHGRRVAAPTGFIRCVVPTADHVPAAVTRDLSRIWGCELFEHYGMTEMGLGGGLECRAHDGCHLREAELLFEVVDPASGRRLPDGTVGELVFTTLTRRAMPLVRYRTGDLARLLPEPCPCGSVLRRIDRIVGRVDGAVRVGQHDLTLAPLDEALLAIDGVDDFTATVEAGRSAGASATLKLVFAKPPGSDGRTDDPALETAIAAALDAVPAVRAARAAGDLAVAVTLLPAGIPFSRGKRTLRQVAAS